MVQVELTPCRFLKSPQSTQPKKPQRCGPVAQDQTSTQRDKPQGGRRARRPGPVVLPTREASGREAGQSPRTSRPPNQRSLREGGGPVAQDQSSFQHKKPQGGRRARRPGPVVHPTKEPQGQSPLGELRSAQSTTSTPPHNRKPVTGPGQVSSCGWFSGVGSAVVVDQ